MLNEFEKYMKDNLESARSSWDKEALWQDIEKQLPSKRRAWLPVLLISGIIGLSLAYLAYTTLIESPEEQVVQQDEFYTADLNTVNKPTASLNAISEKDNLNNDLSKSSDSYFDNSADLVIQQAEIINDVDLKDVKEANVRLAHQVDGNVLPMSDLDVGPVGMEKSEVTSVQDRVLNSSHRGTFKSTLESLAFIHPLSFFLEPKPSLTLVPVLSSEEIEIAPKKKRRMVLGLLTGAGLSSRSLSATTSSDLLTARAGAEEQLENIFASANISYFLSNRWSVDLGFEWRQISERMNFTEMESSVESRYIDTAQYYTNFMGQLSYNGKEVDVITRRQRENVLYNRHIQLLMPIHIGYTHKVSRMGISLAAGPVISLMRNYKGARITEDLGLEKSLDISTSGGSILHGFDIGLSTSFDISPYYALMMGLNYRKALTSYSIDNIGNQSYDLLDARLGLLIHLN